MADALTLEATVQWRPRSGAFPPPWSTRLSSLLLAVLYPHPPGRGRSLCSLEPLRRKVDGATMTTPGGARTPPRELSHLPSCSAHRPLCIFLWDSNRHQKREGSGGANMICAPCSGTTPWRTTMEKHRLAIPEALRRARRTGFYHGVGASSLLGSGPSLCPTPNTRKSSHLAYKDTPFGVCSSPPRKYNLIQSD